MRVCYRMEYRLLEVLSFPKFNEEVAFKRLKSLRDVGLEVDERGATEVKLLGKGHSSVVFLSKHKEFGIVAVKVLRTDSKRDSLKQECKAMKQAQPIAPKIYSCGDEYVVMEFINGVNLEEYLKTLSACDELILLGLKILAVGKYLDDVGVDHHELSVLKDHVLIEASGRIRIVDFESSSLKPGRNLCRVFSGYFIRIPKVKLCCPSLSAEEGSTRELLKSYKGGNKEAYLELVKLILDKCLSSSCVCRG
ncbi:MAG: hypothetical protein B7O98_06805 [Zestosphaera tikiterensis]|uniref:Protein kinase domain-containing protein n=1 Tax=Zestosphaera tikiterensis TaxID=1973259 RepID=A0A2R7Y490_9CREN|nr:MAG: hypothetical protein B7O98_06805 [Zestosphaera tikiterensis]